MGEKQGHTPGPWIRVRGELIGSNGAKVVEYGSGIAFMCGGGAEPEAVANATLRNAAPDLLEIAVRILDRGYVSSSVEEEREDHLALRAAISRATGEEPNAN